MTVKKLLLTVLAFPIFLNMGSEALGKGVDLAERLTALEKNYEGVRTIRGRFEQSFQSQRFPARNAQGLMVFQKPNLMRWDYDEPKGKVFLLDGKHLYLFDPEDEQILKAKQPSKDDLPLALALLSGRAKVREHFVCEWQDEKDLRRDSLIECSPKEEIPNVSKVILQLTDRDAPTIQRTITVDSLGNRNELAFEGLKLNIDLPSSAFLLKAPKDIPIVEMKVDEISIQ